MKSNKIEVASSLILKRHFQNVDSLIEILGGSYDIYKTHQVMEEFLLFNLHFCDRQIFSLLGNEEKNIVMDGVVKNLFSIMKNTSKDRWGELYKELTHNDSDENLSLILDIFAKAVSSQNIIKKYNKRQVEYSKYTINYAVEDNPKGTLTWEFGKKMAILLTGGPDAIAAYSMQVLATENMIFYSQNLKAILE